MTAVLHSRRMRHPLQVQEILSNIFVYQARGRDLADLARTCRAFKEPALNVLWSDLEDLSPISRCLPEVSVKLDEDSPPLYGFSRLLQPAELDTLKSYTRRIRQIQNFHGGIDWESVGSCIDIPSITSLFPCLQTVHCKISQPQAYPLLSLPLPSLKSLIIRPPDEPGERENIRTCRDLLQSFTTASPNVTVLSFEEFLPNSVIPKIIIDNISSWPGLNTVSCSGLELSVDVFAHLSGLPELRTLAITGDNYFPNQHITRPPFNYSNLVTLKLSAPDSYSVSKILSYTQLPALVTFSAEVESRPTKEDLNVLSASIKGCRGGATINEFWFQQDFRWKSKPDQAELLDLGGLQPLMAFTNLSVLVLDLGWEVRLKDGDLIILAQAWPNLQRLDINERWGWNRRDVQGGITPHGLLRLLQTSPSLSSFSLAIDTRDFTTPLAIPSTLRLEAVPHRYQINVLDSVIEEENIPAMAAFFAAIVPHFDFDFAAWDVPFYLWRWSRHREYSERWRRVYAQANEALKAQCLKLVEQEILFRPGAHS